MQDVIDAVVAACLFNGRDVGGLFDDADEPLVPDRACAVAAGIDVGDVVADGTEAKVQLKLSYGERESFSVLRRGAEDMECEALCALGADSRELPELFDETRHRFGKAAWGGVERTCHLAQPRQIRQSHATHHPREAGLHGVIGTTASFVYSRGDEVFEKLEVAC